MSGIIVNNSPIIGPRLLNCFRIGFLICSCLLLHTQLAAEDFYWVGGTGKWSDYGNHWMTSSGGNVSQGRVPNLRDNIFIDENSFTAPNQEIQIDILVAEVNEMTLFNANQPFVIRTIAGGRNLIIYAGFHANDKYQSDLDEIIFNGTSDTNLIISGGNRIARNVQINSGNQVDLHSREGPIANNLTLSGPGNVRLQDSLVVSQNLNINNGSFDTDNKSISANVMRFSGRNTVISLNTSKIYASSWEARSIRGFDAGESQVFINNPWNGMFNGAGLTYNDVALCGKIRINGNNQFNTLTFCEASDIEIYGGNRQTTNQLVADGTAATPIRIASTEYENTAFISQRNGTVDATSLNLEDIHAQGGATFNADISVALNNVEGWNIIAPIPKTFYWVGGTGNWSDYEHHWATSSGGQEFHEALPNVYDRVIFDENSFSVGGDLNIDLYNIYAGTIDFSEVDESILIKVVDPSVANIPFLRMHVFGSMFFSNMVTSDIDYIRFKTEGSSTVDSNEGYIGEYLEFYHEGIYKIFAHNMPIADNVELKKNGDTYIEDSLVVNRNLTLSDGSLFADRTYVRAGNLTLINGNVDIYGSEIQTGTWSIMQVDQFVSDSSHIYATANFIGGDRDYHNVTLCGLVYVNGANTYNKLIFCPGSDIYLPAGFKQLADTLSISGNASFPVSISSNIEGQQSILEQRDGSVDTRYMYLKDNVGVGVPFNADESVDLGNVTGWNITKPAAEIFFWVNGEGLWSEFNRHWATSSGGVSYHSRIPGAFDQVIFDENSFPNSLGSTVSIDQIKAYANSVDFSSVQQSFNVANANGDGRNKFLNIGSFAFNEMGNSSLAQIIFPSDTASNSINSEGRFLASNLVFEHMGTYEIDAQGEAIAHNILVNEGGNIELSGALTLQNLLQITNGSINTNDQGLKIPQVELAFGGGQASANIGNSHIETGSWKVGQQANVLSDSSTINVLNPSGSAFFYGGGQQYHDVNAACIVNFSGNNQYNTLTFTYGAKVYVDGTHRMHDLVAIGTSGNPIKIIGGSFNRDAGRSKNQYLILNDNRSGGQGQLIAERSIDGGGNTGWMITGPDSNIDANELNVLNGDPLCGDAIETTLSLPEGLLTTYQWYKDNVPIDHDSSTLVVSEEGVYQVELTNACGTVARSNAIDISREGPPEVPNIEHDGNLSICRNDRIDVNLSTEVQPRVHYVWLQDGQQVGYDEPEFQAGEVGTYRLRLTKGACIVDSEDSVLIVVKQNVPQIQTVILQGNDTICSGDSTQLFVEYEPGTTYLWSNEDTVVISELNEFYAEDPGLYTLQLENGCGLSDADGAHQITVMVPPMDQNITRDVTGPICYYDSVVLSVPPEDEVVYEWQVNNDQAAVNSTGNIAYSDTAGVYSVRMTNRCGSTLSDEVTIEHLYPPEARSIALSGDSTFCEGDSIVLSVEGTMDEQMTWFDRSDTLTRNRSEIIVTDPGYYGALVSNKCGTTPALNQISTKVVPVPQETIVRDIYQRCGPGEVEVAVLGGEDGNYVWRDENGNIIPGLVAQEIMVPLNSSKSYFVTISNGYCEGPGNPVNMKVLDVPEADAGEDMIVNYGDEVNIGANAAAADTYYRWTPTDGLVNSTAPITKTKPVQTTMYVLEAIAQNTCSTFDSVLVTVTYELVIPNTFTPNNDGTNDQWQIRNIDFHPESTLEIFDRWGTKVYEKKGYQNDWDGTYNGKKLPVDTYFYVVQLGDDSKPRKGPLTILR